MLLIIKHLQGLKFFYSPNLATFGHFFLPDKRTGRPINWKINQKSMSSLGRKIILPMIAAVIAQIKTAPAQISFTSRILSSFSGCTTSDNRSMAELIASAVKTSPIAKITAIHSAVEILKNKPATGVISNQLLEDLDRIWALRDVIPNP